MRAVSSSFKRKIYFVVVNESRFKFIQAKANNPGRFDKPWQLYDRIVETLPKPSKTVGEYVWVQFDARKEKNNQAVLSL